MLIDFGPGVIIPKQNLKSWIHPEAAILVAFKNIFINNTSDKLMTKIYKELIKLNTKKSIQSNEKMGKGPE